MCWLAERMRVATRPADLPWSMVAAASVLTGIGFTLSIFIAGLAFDPTTADAAKVGILTASAISGSVGLLLLFLSTSLRRAHLA
jgi:NhaA family Na+:H+ antiporter